MQIQNRKVYVKRQAFFVSMRKLYIKGQAALVSFAKNHDFFKMCHTQYIIDTRENATNGFVN